MKNIILISIMVILLSSVCNAIRIPISVIKYYANGVHNSNGRHYVETYRSAVIGVVHGEIPYMATFDDSTVNIYGGEIGTIWITDNSSVNFFGGDTMDYSPITIDKSGKLNIFGYNFVYFDCSDTSSLWGIKGKWGTGVPFEMIFRGTPCDSPAISLYNIPEPATIIFLGIGLVCFDSRRKVKSKSGDVGRSRVLNSNQLNIK
jgi:hypothetical protein